MYDIIIIGGGPAGVAAGIYAGRKKLKTLFLTDNFGGQSIVSDSIENWIGETKISGIELAQKLEKHLREHDEIKIKTGVVVKEIKEVDCGFEVFDSGESHKAKTIMIASGARRRKLGIPGEENFDGKGVAYCSTCDAPLFRGRDVAVVGAGNSGLEAVIDLIPYANKIYLLSNTSELKGDQETQLQIRGNEKVEILYNAKTKEVLGEKLVTGLVVVDLETQTEKTLNVGGVFVEIGCVPNSELVKDLVELNIYGEIVVDHKTYETSKKGIYAAGDVTDEIYKQNNIAAGDAITAILSAYNYLSKLNKQSPSADCE